MSSGRKSDITTPPSKSASHNRASSITYRDSATQRASGTTVGSAGNRASTGNTPAKMTHTPPSIGTGSSQGNTQAPVQYTTAPAMIAPIPAFGQNTQSPQTAPGGGDTVPKAYDLRSQASVEQIRVAAGANKTPEQHRAEYALRAERAFASSPFQ